MTRPSSPASARARCPTREKRKRADYVVLTGLGKRHTLEALRRIVDIVGRRGRDEAAREKRLKGTHARDRPRHRDDRPRSVGRPPHRRGRLPRARQSHADRAHLPALRQSRARHARGGVRGARPVGRIPRRQAALRRRSRTICSPSSATRRSSSTTPRSTSASSMPSLTVSAGRRSTARAPSTPSRWRARNSPARGQPRRAVPALRDRQLGARPSTARCSTRSCWPRSIWS